MVNDKHKGPHCAGLCEGTAYISRIKELEAEVASMHDNFAKMNTYYGDQADRIEELEAEVERLRLGLTYVVGNGINTDALEGE